MGHVISSGQTWNSNSNQTSSFSSVWGAASFRFGNSEHGEREGGWRWSEHGGFNGQHYLARGQGSNIITSGGDRRHDQQIDRQIADVWGKIG